MEDPPAAMTAILADNEILGFIVKQLPPVDIVRAALACRRWRRAFALAIPRAPPLVGYLCLPEAALTSPLLPRANLPAVFVPRDASSGSSPNLSLPLASEDPRDLQIQDAHLGLVLLLPYEVPDMLLLRILVVDPASGRRALLSPPPRNTLPEEQWRQTRHFIGAAVLSRAHPSKLRFEVVCVTLEDDGPRVWIAFVEDGTCLWRALSQSMPSDDLFYLTSVDRRCTRADSKIFWRICNSGSLLALHRLTLELSFLPSTAEQENPFNQYTSRGKETELGHLLIAPYYLSWPPAFLSVPEEGGLWVEDVMLMLRVAIYNICGTRKLFPREFFGVICSQSDVEVRTLIPSDDESQRLVEWVEKGVYDALGKKFLRTVLLSICEEGGPLIEEYSFTFTYGQEVIMELQLPDCAESVWTFKVDAADSSPEQILSSIFAMVKKLVSRTRTYQQIPEERDITMKLLYHDSVTPLSYEPPFFKSYYDVTSQKLEQTSFRDITGGSTCSEIAQGHFYCISQKKVSIYFDSGASRHIFCDRDIIQGLSRVAKEHLVNLDTPDNGTICLKCAGHVNYNGIVLEPVYWDDRKGRKHNVISLGQLDDGNNIIFLGDRQIQIINIKTGSLIGEGTLHERKNRYLATSIKSVKKLTPGRKKRAIAADATESEPSLAVENLREPPTDIEKKTSWVIDCFCNNHLTCNEDMLSNTQPADVTFVTAAGEFKATRVGKVKTENVTLSDVYYCPTLSTNFISEGQLDREGYIFTRLNHKCTIQWKKSKQIVGIAYQDKKFVYNVDYFHPHSSKRLKQFEATSKSLKRTRQYEESSSS